MKTVYMQVQALVLTLLAVFGLSVAAFSQTTLFTEDFESAAIGQSPPSGWAIDAVSGLPDISFVSTGTHPTCSPASGSRMVEFNSFAAGTGTETRLRMTSPISTVGRTLILVDFKWLIDTDYGGSADRVNVQYSLNGTTWTTAGYVTRPGSTQAWVTQTVALPAAAAGQSTLYIAFDFVSYYGNNCHLDLVHVLSCGPLSPATLTVGTGTSTCNYPYATYWMGARTQLLYTASDLYAAGVVPGMITSIGFSVATASTQAMQNFNLRLLNTPLSSISGWTTGLQTCYSGTYSVPGTGWQMITLQTPFYWDGSNLIMEICYGSNGSYTTNTSLNGTSAVSGQIVSYWNDNLTGCTYSAAPYTTTVLPNLRLTEQPYSGVLLGTVCNNFNGLGQTGMTVTCGSQSAPTNAAGNYVMYNVPVGSYNVNFTGAGFYSSALPATVSNGTSTVKNNCLSPVFSTIQGTVTSAQTGNPIVGAMISINNQTTATTGPGGNYTLSYYSFDPFTIQVSKPGYSDASEGPINFVYGTTTTHNYALTEYPNAPDHPVAALNAGQTSVNITWGVPKGYYEVLYDDGNKEALSQWPLGGNYNAVRFTPAAWPCQIMSVRYNIGQQGDYPAGSNPLVGLSFLVYDDSGPGGTPGNLIAGPIATTPFNFGWNTAYLWPYPTITSGGFYIVHQQGGNAPNAAGLAIDNTTNQMRSYMKTMPGGSWTQASGNFLLRANVFGPGGPLPAMAAKTGEGDPAAAMDNPGNAASLTGYQVYRFILGQENNQPSWVLLGTTANLSFADNNWSLLPCSPYRWAVKAAYQNGNVSGPAFSNPIGKCWSVPVTVNVFLNSCPGAAYAGTFIKLQNTLYPDTLYQVALGAQGTYTFPSVFKGDYTLTVQKYGYSPYSLTPVSVTSAMATGVTLQPVLYPPSNLSVDSHTLKATWNPPDFSSVVFSENWSSGDFNTNYWATDGGTNWTLTPFAGNAAPSAIFQSFPTATNYNESLTSREITGTHSAVLKLYYDLFMNNLTAPGTNFLNVEIWNGTAWVVLNSYSTASNIPWTTVTVDLSAYTHKSFRVRFRAYGASTASLSNWKIDNIRVVADEPALAVCQNGYNFSLDGNLVAVPATNSFTIPTSYSVYGQNITACVSAAYASGNSSSVCVPFTDKYLCSPMNLAVSDAGSTATLTWTKPFCDPGNQNCFVYDDGSMENGWMSFPNTVLWYGNKMNVGTNQSGQLTSVKMKWWNSPYATQALPFQVDIFSLAGVLLGSTPVFNVPLVAPTGYMQVDFTTPVNYSGPFYCMVKWNNLATYSHYLGYDQNGPNALAGLDFVYDGTNFTPMTTYWPGVTAPGVFCLLACGTASMDGPVTVIAPVPGPAEGHSRGPAGPAPCLPKGSVPPAPAPGTTLAGESDSPLSDASLIGYNIYMASDSIGPYTLTSYSEGADILTASVTGLSAGVHWFKVAGYYDLGPIGFPGSFDESAPAGPQAAYIGIIPYNRNVSDIMINNGQAFCYDALNTLTFAGPGKSFTVSSGGSALMVAGQKISYLQGSKVLAGGYMHGSITTSGQYCTPGKSAAGLSAGGDDLIQKSASDASFFRAWPNPTRGDVTVELAPGNATGIAGIEVYSPMGERLAAPELNGEKRLVIPFGGRPAGIYFLRVRSGDRTGTARIVVVR